MGKKGRRLRMTKRKELGRRDPEGRREAILQAGLAVFSDQGFAATKLDDVAEKAGVAKGTIYLHFKDKQDLFEQMVREAVCPVIARLEALAQAPDLPADRSAQGVDRCFPHRGAGHAAQGRAAPGHDRRPALSRHCRVLPPRGGVARPEAHGRAPADGPAKGELSADGCRPLSAAGVAPLILAVVWDGLFAAIEPLDVGGLLAVYRELLLGRAKQGEENGHEAQAPHRRGWPCSCCRAAAPGGGSTGRPRTGRSSSPATSRCGRSTSASRSRAASRASRSTRATAIAEGQVVGAAWRGFISRTASPSSRPSAIRPRRTWRRWRPATGRRRSRRPRPPSKEREATLANTKIALDRAEQLLNERVGTRKAFDDAQAAHREAEARLNSARARLAADARRVPGRGHRCRPRPARRARGRPAGGAASACRRRTGGARARAWC